MDGGPRLWRLDLVVLGENVVFVEAALGVLARGTPKATSGGRGWVGLAGAGIV